MMETLGLNLMNEKSLYDNISTEPDFMDVFDSDMVRQFCPISF